MQKRNRPENENADEHSAPTEPLLPVVGQTVPDGEIASNEKLLPPSQPYPQQQTQGASQIPGPFSPSSDMVYPVLPPAIQQGHRPAGSAAPTQRQKPTGSVRSGRSPIPLCVGIFFVAVQFLLLISFIIRLLNLSPYQGWLGIIYAISGIFLLPFRLLSEHVTLPFSLTIGVEVYTLVAILVYGLLSRLLVGLLKVLLRSR